MKLKYILILLLSLYIVHSTLYITHATVRFVSKSGTSTPPYTSWLTAADSIQKCINICVDGDTVYVANGVYKETLVINTAISLIGSSMDSTVIDGRSLQAYNTVEIRNIASITNIAIIGQDINNMNSTAVAGFFDDFVISSCRLSNAHIAVFTGYTSSKIIKCIITSTNQAIAAPCFPDTCHVVVDSCIIITKLYEPAMTFTYGSPTITNNIIIEESNQSIKGINLDATTRRAIIKNNLIAGYDFSNINVGFIQDSVIIYSNNSLYTLRQNSPGSILTYTGSKTIIENNIIGFNYRGLNAQSEPVESDYNLYWENEINTGGYAVINDSDIITNPMFIKDTLPNPQLDFDYHLQAYSPAIDKGDPEILDKDKTRSDIGMYGGPLSEIYAYVDLAPLAPRNLSAVVDTNTILVKWNKNTESDTAYYRVYRDTVINFQIDSTKLVSSSADTFFVQPNPHINTKYVYKITCVDKQGNESLPSTELVVNITSVSTNDYPMTINDYQLYQNYPNPFNPSTKIGYKLKYRGYVKVMVYDLKGELVTVLVNKEQNDGYYEVEFTTNTQLPTTNNLASGIYLYRIEVIGEGNIPVYTDMKKMILIK